MNTSTTITAMESMKSKLQTLWIFLMLNWLYCDILSNMEAGVLQGYLTGSVGNIQVTPTFLLGSAILMEIPIAMVLLSRVLKYRANRWANIIAGTIMAAVQLASFSFGTGPTPHYVFYSIIEVACAAFIVWSAWNWRNPA